MFFEKDNLGYSTNPKVSSLTHISCAQPYLHLSQEEIRLQFYVGKSGDEERTGVVHVEEGGEGNEEGKGDFKMIGSKL